MSSPGAGCRPLSGACDFPWAMAWTCHTSHRDLFPEAEPVSRQNFSVIRKCGSGKAQLSCGSQARLYGLPAWPGHGLLLPVKDPAVVGWTPLGVVLGSEGRLGARMRVKVLAKISLLSLFKTETASSPQMTFSVLPFSIPSSSSPSVPLSPFSLSCFPFSFSS